MCRKNVILCLLLYLIITQDKLILAVENSNFYEVMKSHNIQTEWSNESTSKVWFNNVSYEIYIYKYTDDQIFESYYYYSKPNELYTCINCEFATWTRDQLFDFVKRFPLLYRSTFYYTHNNIFIRHYERFVQILDYILKYIERFIRILSNFMNMNKYNLSLDTDVFKTLISLHLKINFIKTLQYGTFNDGGIDNSNVHKSVDDIIIRSILEIINSLQYFMSVNCNFSSYYNNRRFYGYPINMDSRLRSINDFLGNLYWIEFSINYCTAEKLISNDIINLIHNSVELNSPYGRILVIDVIKKIQHSYNLDTILWCQELMVKSIMKVLFYKILRVLKNQTFLNNGLIENLEYIYHSIQSYVNNLPIELMQPFTLLISKEHREYSENDELVLSVNKYLESLDDFNLRVDLSSNTDETNTSNNNGFPENDTFSGIHDNDISDESDLEQYLHRIISVGSDFKCLIWFYAFLYNENNKTYYTPFMRNTINKNSLLQILMMESNENTSKMSNAALKMEINRNLTDEKCAMIEEGCKYIKGLYELCIYTMIVLNSSETKNNYNNAKEIFIYVETYLLAFFNTSHWDRPIFVIAYTILPLVQSTIKRFNQNFNVQVYNDLRRLISMVMVLFDKYGLEFCSNPMKYNYLFFNQINFYLFKIDQSTPQIPHGIIESLDKFRKSNDNRRASHTFISLSHFYEENYNSANISAYNGIIKLNWKGDNWDMKEITKYIISAVLNPFYWYAINDFYMKFYIAVIFYEINEIYKIYDAKIFKCKTFFLNIQYYFEVKKFPNYFDTIIDNVKTYLSILHNTFCVKDANGTEVITERQKELFNLINFQLAEIGIFVKVETPTLYLSTDASSSTEIYQTDYEVQNSTLLFLKDFIKLFYSVEEISNMLTRMIDVERLDNNEKVLYHIQF